MLNRQGRPTGADDASAAEHPTFTGNRALQQEEPLIFEIGRTDATGVDLDEPETFTPRLGGLERTGEIGLPGLTEPEAMRHYVRLSQKNFGIDTGLFPLGSCTMKHNARLNERVARLPGIGDIHPLQPVSTVQGALELMSELARYLTTLTGMPAVALSPKAGAHGELLRHDGDQGGDRRQGRGRYAPDGAGAGFGARHQSGDRGADRLHREAGAGPGRWLGPCRRHAPAARARRCGDHADEPEHLRPVRAADRRDRAGAARGRSVFLLRRRELQRHRRQGAAGRPRRRRHAHQPAQDLLDAARRRRAGGGPGGAVRAPGTVRAGAVRARASLPPAGEDRLARSASEEGGLAEGTAGVSSGATPTPTPPRKGEGTYALVEHEGDAGGAAPLGRITAFHGQMGMYVRALAYMLSHGSDGMRQASEDAVLNANYVRAGLSDLMSLPFGDKPCMHEVLFDDAWLKDTGVTTLDFAKAMIDEGYHPMTMYFPLVVHGAMLIEPTKSESKASLDLFVAALRDLAMAAKRGDAERFSGAPYHAPRRRLDETRAARQPILKWAPPKPLAEAAE